MPRLEVLKYPDPRLEQVSQPVTEFDSQLHRLLDDMAITMYAENGVGLAAAQVGAFVRLFVVDVAQVDDGPRQLYEFINPKLSQGEGEVVFEEGCLSVPGANEEVKRKARIRIDFQDRNGNPKSMQVEGLFAVALQHENDHLDGILFINRLSPLKRKFVKRRLNKALAL